RPREVCSKKRLNGRAHVQGSRRPGRAAAKRVHPLNANPQPWHLQMRGPPPVAWVLMDSVASVTGRPGELSERLLDAVDRPEPQLRAVATTLLIKALDVPGEEQSLIESMVASDDAAVMIDP